MTDQMLDQYFIRMIYDDADGRGRVVAKCRLCRKVCSHKRSHLEKNHIITYNRIYRNPTTTAATTSTVPTVTATITANGERHSFASSGPLDIRIEPESSLYAGDPSAVDSEQEFNEARRSFSYYGSANNRSEFSYRRWRWRRRRYHLRYSNTPAYGTRERFRARRRPIIDASLRNVRSRSTATGTPEQFSNEEGPSMNNSYSSNNRIRSTLRPANTAATGTPEQFSNEEGPFMNNSYSSNNRIRSTRRPSNTSATGTPEQFSNEEGPSMNSYSSNNRMRSNSRAASIPSVDTRQQSVNYCCDCGEPYEPYE